MIGVATMRTAQGVTLAPPAQAAARTVLARVSRVDLCHAHAAFLCFVGHARSDETMLPERETTAQGFASNLAFLWLRNVQVFKDQHGVVESKVNQVFGRLLSKGARAIALFATKPFQHTAHTSGVLVLCLTGRQFLFETGACLDRLSVLDLDRLATDEEFSSIGVNGNQGIGFIEVNADWQDTCWCGNFKGHSQAPDEFPVAHENCEAIKLKSGLEDGKEMLRNSIAQAFSSRQRPDREFPGRQKRGITPALADEEKGRGFLEEEGMPGWFVVARGRMIGSCYQTNSRDPHLSVEDALDLMVVPTLQGKGIHRLASVVARLRECLLDLSKRLNGALQVLIRLDDDGDSALDLHGTVVPRRTCPVKLLLWKEERQFPHMPQGSGPLPPNGGKRLLIVYGTDGRTGRNIP